MNVRFLAPAQKELDEAVEYYESQLPGLGIQFLSEIREAVENVKRFPHAWHRFSENTRRYRTKRFPYGIIYQFLDHEILIVAIAHLHREPGYWCDRAK